MTTQLMSTVAARIAAFKGEMLSHAEPQEVIGTVCRSMKRSIPKHSSATVKYRRVLPKGATTSTPNTWAVDPATHVTSESETPPAETISFQDINATLVQYAVLYRYSDLIEDLYEDDVPKEMVKLVGERMGLLREMIRYGGLKAGTNIFYSGTATARSGITLKISNNLFRRVARSLEANLAMKMTRILEPSDAVGTRSVEAAYIVVCHTDMAADLRSQLTDFLHVSDYGSRKVIHENELGSWDQFRFVTSPHLAPYLLAGGVAAIDTVLANGASCTGANASDVYPMLVLAEEAYGDVMLRGMDSFNAYHRKPGGSNGMESSSDDPLGQRGFVGAKFYFTTVRLNELHMAVVETACGSLVG